MIKKNLVQKIAGAVACCIVMGMSTPAYAKSTFTGEYRLGEILVLGASLSNSEELKMRETFGVAKDMKAIYVDNKTAIEQLGLAPNALDNYTGGWYSSAHVQITKKGGIKVTSENVTLVTNEMYTNALITSGIKNCKVMVSAPFSVTGESALAGILAGAEEIMGESLNDENKEVAKEEIDITLEIADDILNNSNNISSEGDSSIIASGIINDIKTEVIKDSFNNNTIGDIIINVTNNYGVELSEESNEKIMTLMEDIDSLNIDYKDYKDTLNNIGEKIKNDVKNIEGFVSNLKESGFFEKIGNWFKEMISNIGEWFKSLFEKDEVNEVVPEEIVDEDGQVDAEEQINEDSVEEIVEDEDSVEEIVEDEESLESDGSENEAVEEDEIKSEESVSTVEENANATEEVDENTADEKVAE